MKNTFVLMSKTKKLKSTVTSIIKKPFLALLAILLLLALPATMVNAESSNQGITDNVIYITTTYGDLNNDYSVDSLDYALMKSLLLDNNNIINKSSDLNGDHQFNALDLSIMKQYLLQKIYIFPVDATFQTTKTGSIINVEENKSFEICLTECASTGYQWVPKLSDNTALSLYSIESLIDINTQIPGCSTPEVWTFKALKAGTYTLTLESIRPWEEPEEGLIDTVKYTINVTKPNA